MNKTKYTRYTDSKYTNTSQSKIIKNNGIGGRGNSRGSKENDKFHTGLLFGVLIMAYGLNHAFGFSVGTIPYGTLFALAIAVWTVIAVVDYFKGS